MKLYFLHTTRHDCGLDNISKSLSQSYQQCIVTRMLTFHSRVLCSSQTSCPGRRCCRNLMRTGRSGTGSTTSTTGSPTMQTANMGISGGIRFNQTISCTIQKFCSNDSAWFNRVEEIISLSFFDNSTSLDTIHRCIDISRYFSRDKLCKNRDTCQSWHKSPTRCTNWSASANRDHSVTTTSTQLRL